MIFHTPKAFEIYKQWVLKVLPQACAQDDEILTHIINFYKSIKDTDALATLDTRLKILAAKCVDLSDDK